MSDVVVCVTISWQNEFFRNNVFLVLIASSPFPMVTVRFCNLFMDVSPGTKIPTKSRFIQVSQCSQWRIQDFPEGCHSQSGIIFSRKLHENERIWNRVGGFASLALLWIRQCNTPYRKSARFWLVCKIVLNWLSLRIFSCRWTENSDWTLKKIS